MLGVLAAMLMQGAAPVTAAVAPRKLTKDDIVWVKRPSGSDVAKLYPDAALRADASGSIILHCTVDAEGKLSPCGVAYEVPTGKGFGGAALKLSKGFQMRTTLADGSSAVGATYDLPVNFGIMTSPPR